MKNLIIILLSFLILTSFKKDTEKPLKGLVVIIDPGHGGLDEGSYGLYGPFKNKIIESSYCYDIALRLEKLLLSKGATVYKTVSSRYFLPIDFDKKNYIEKDTNSIFTYDGSKVNSSLLGLSKRVYFANQKLKVYQNKNVVYIAIHFDKLPSSISGARIITGQGSYKLAFLVKFELDKEKLTTSHKFPILLNGDKKKGIRNLVVLRNTNKVSQKLLIEFGNFNHPDDLDKLLDFKQRDKYAEVLTNSLIKYVEFEKLIKNKKN